MASFTGVIFLGAQGDDRTSRGQRQAKLQSEAGEAGLRPHGTSVLCRRGAARIPFPGAGRPHGISPVVLATSS